MGSPHLVEVNDGNFDTEVLKSNVPVLVDFWATWCAPCRAIAPTIEKLAAEYQGKLKVCKMDVDNSPSTPAKFGIRGIPTCIVFKGGQEVNRVVGAVPAAKLVDAVKSYL